MISTFALLFLFRTPVSEPTETMFTGTAAGIPVRVVRINLADPRVHISAQVSSGCPGNWEDFEAMVARSKPTLAVNGAYFSKGSLKPIGDIVAGGKLVSSGMMGTALAVTKDNEAIIKRVKWGHAEDWSEYETVLGCGPALMLGGKLDVQPEHEGFHDPHVMGSAKRLGVGLTPDKHLLIVTTLAPVTFVKWADVMRGLGCTDAMNLDAGASLAMYYHGKTLIKPGRKLTNLLLVHIDSADRIAASARTAKIVDDGRSTIEKQKSDAAK
jgi:exopolysaccharide biosynthesis protein